MNYIALSWLQSEVYSYIWKAGCLHSEIPMAACGDDYEHKIIYSEVPLAQHLILLVMTGG